MSRDVSKMEGDWDKDEGSKIVDLLQSALNEPTPPSNKVFGLAGAVKNSSTNTIAFSGNSTITAASKSSRGRPKSANTVTSAPPQDQRSSQHHHQNQSESTSLTRKNLPPKIPITPGKSLSINKTSPPSFSSSAAAVSEQILKRRTTSEDIESFSDDPDQNISRRNAPTYQSFTRKENQANRAIISIPIKRKPNNADNFSSSRLNFAASQSDHRLDFGEYPTRSNAHQANMRAQNSQDSLVTTGATTGLDRTAESQRRSTLPLPIHISGSEQWIPAVTAHVTPPNSFPTRVQPQRGAKKSPLEIKEPECIDLVDEDDIDMINPWIKPIASQMFVTEKIYFGNYEQKPIGINQKNYFRITDKANGFVFVFGLEKREELQFFDIDHYQFGSYSDEQSLGYLMIQVKPTTRFHYIVCGAGKTLDPTVTRGHKLKKYITILLSQEDCIELQKVLQNIPSMKSKNGIGEIDNHLITIINQLRSSDQSNMEQTVMKELQERHDQFNPEKPRTRRRASLLNDGLFSTYSKEDSRVYLIYPPELEATDAVTISYGDLKRLDPGVYFNDNLIDLKIKHLISTLPEEKRKKVHAFSCLFYAKLLEANDPKSQHQLVHRWTKNVDLFSLDFILFPINLRNHWSLMVMARPQSWIQQQKAASIKGEKVKEKEEEIELDSIGEDKENEEKTELEEDNVGVFLHLDSLKMHPTTKIVEVLADYLLNEKEAKENAVKNETDSNMGDSATQRPEAATTTKSASKKNDNITELDSPVSNKDFEGPLVNTDDEDYLPNETSSSLKKTKRKFSAKKRFVSPTMKKEKVWVKCQVPMQENGYDCGVFVIRFAEMIFDKWPTTTPSDLRENCKRQFMREFSQSDIDQERQDIRSLLKSLREDWLLKNPEKAKEQEADEEAAITVKKENEVSGAEHIQSTLSDSLFHEDESFNYFQKDETSELITEKRTIQPLVENYFPSPAHSPVEADDQDVDTIYHPKSHSFEFKKPNSFSQALSKSNKSYNHPYYGTAHQATTSSTDEEGDNVSTDEQNTTSLQMAVDNSINNKQSSNKFSDEAAAVLESMEAVSNHDESKEDDDDEDNNEMKKQKNGNHEVIGDDDSQSPDGKHNKRKYSKFKSPSLASSPPTSSEKRNAVFAVDQKKKKNKNKEQRR